MAGLNTSASVASISGAISNDNSLNADLEAQKIATELRLDFLKVLTSLEGKEVAFNLYGKSASSSGKEIRNNLSLWELGYVSYYPRLLI